MIQEKKKKPKPTSSKIVYQPNKELGQNFLFDKNYLRKIIVNCPIDNNTIIIEIGSGYGSLTNLLAKTKCRKIIGIEKDQKLFRWLDENNKNDRIVYFNKDALLIDWLDFCSKYQNNSLIIVGNLPYYITNSLIVNLIFCRHLFKSLIFLVQKEVGERWVASPSKYSSKYSALSVFINYSAETQAPFEVPRRVFSPSPSVDGSLVVINPYKNINLTKEVAFSFLRFLKNCFRFRRKTLLNNLNSFAGNRKTEWKKYFVNKDYSTKIRPQNLTPKEYFQLFLFWQSLS